MNSTNQMNKDSNSINITGLTDEEVRQRVEEGFTNRTDISTDNTPNRQNPAGKQTFVYII